MGSWGLTTKILSLFGVNLKKKVKKKIENLIHAEDILAYSTFIEIIATIPSNQSMA